MDLTGGAQVVGHIRLPTHNCQLRHLWMRCKEPVQILWYPPAVKSIQSREVRILRQTDSIMNLAGEVRDISEPTQILFRLPDGEAVFQCLQDILPVDVVPGRLAVLFIEIDRTGRRLVRHGNDGQAVCLTVIV